MSDSKSIHHKDIGAGTVKNYSNGVVGFQIKNTSHDTYKANMESLKGVNANSNNLLSQHFGQKR